MLVLKLRLLLHCFTLHACVLSSEHGRCQASGRCVCSCASTFPDPEFALLADSTCRRRPRRLLECLTRRAHVLEGWQVGFAVGATVRPVWLQMVGDLRRAAALDHLPLQIVGDRRQSLDLLLQVRHEVLHALAAEAHYGLLHRGLGAGCISSSVARNNLKPLLLATLQILLARTF